MLRIAIMALHHEAASWGSWLGLDVDRLVVVFEVDDRRQVELLRIARRKAGMRSALHCMGVRTPLRSPR